MAEKSKANIEDTSRLEKQKGSPKESEINQLCKELLKKRPNQKKVRSLMKDQGLIEHQDPLLQLGAALELLDHQFVEEVPKGNPSDEAGVL